MRVELQGEIRRLRSRGIIPGLAAVLVGDNPASTTYVRMKGKACDEAGLYHENDPAQAGDHRRRAARAHRAAERGPQDSRYPRPIAAAEAHRRAAGAAPRVIGEGRGRLSPGKRWEGLDRHPTGFRPATPYGVQQLLVRSGIEDQGSARRDRGSFQHRRPAHGGALAPGRPGGNATSRCVTPARGT